MTRHNRSSAILRAILLWGLFLVLIPSPQAAGERLNAGRQKFIFKPFGAGHELRVWYYKPKSFSDTSPIVFVMHGATRNAKKYRDIWIPQAQTKHFLLIVPEFSKADYPSSVEYNLGNMFSPSGEVQDEALWSYTVIEDLFDHIKSLTRSRVSAYSIYGHSAGAQFVHRLVMFKPHARINTAIAANAGWYTLPADTQTFPYGLKNSGTDLKAVSSSFDKTLIILLGTEDTDENDRYLRKTAEAMAQGPHRFARGQYFFQTARQAADRLHMGFQWKMMVVPGVGHSNRRMSGPAATLF